MCDMCDIQQYVPIWLGHMVTKIEEGIIHRLGEGFYQHKILSPQVILYSI